MRIELELNRKDRGMVLLSGMVGDEDQSRLKEDACTEQTDCLSNVQEKAGFVEKGVDSVRTERKGPKLLPLRRSRAYSCGC